VSHAGVKARYNPATPMLPNVISRLGRKLANVRIPDVAWRSYALAAMAASSACHAQPRHQVAEVAVDVRRSIAVAEGRRSDGVNQLIALAQRGGAAGRWLSLRGLARIGDGPSRSALRQLLDHDDALTVAQAASALGMVGALEQIPADEADAISTDLLRCLPRVKNVVAPVLEALGRAGGPNVQQALAIATGSPSDDVAATAALALGRHGRRKLQLSIAAVDALVVLASHHNRDVRYAAVYALGRQVVATAPGATASDHSESEAAAGREKATVTALLARLNDADAEIRAVAVAGLGKRLNNQAPPAELLASLRDADWRVAVEAVRAIATPQTTSADAVAIAITARVAKFTQHRQSNELHVVRAAVELLQPFASSPAVAAMSNAVSAAHLDNGDIDCWNRAFAVRSPPLQSAGPLTLSSLMSCGGTAFGAGDRASIVAELIKAGVGDLSDRTKLTAGLLTDKDSSVRAAALTAVDGINAPWSLVTTALAERDAVVVGAACDAADRALEANVSDSAAIEAALLARARTETDPELASNLIAVIAKYKIAGGADVCAGVVAHPVVMAARAECLKKFDRVDASAAASTVFAPGIVPEPTPQRWHIITTRGTIDILLDGQLAPWHVAVISSLTKRRFYNGLRFHRFVGNFVVQGGDPTGTGWGGPGFVVPSEVSSILDANATFTQGAIGFADAGKDTGGSQWFAMHSRSPHLDSRYTQVGHIITGLDVAMSLSVGDKIVTATIESAVR
jgi:cyclophilin family peptidyl-prolyl cis-trans isomerase/HEAT repeat protein